MKTLGIIAEYNPFHPGHKYQIDKAREATNADCVIAVMSGNFVQRGEPAIADKITRAKTALVSGIDLVVELPVLYSTAGAQIFAYGGVSILDKLGADYISFGAETKDVTLLQTIADYLFDEPEEYSTSLKKHLAGGASFALARSLALSDCGVAQNIIEELSKPNNILGIEYLKAIRYFNSTMTPVPIARKGAGYNDTDTDTIFASATGIRRIMSNRYEALSTANCADTEDYSKFLSSEVNLILAEEFGKTMPILPDDVSPLLSYALESNKTYVHFADSTENISNKICNLTRPFYSIPYNELIDALKTKELTYSRLSRVMAHILLGITQDKIKYCADNSYPVYARILGFNDAGQQYLHEIRDNEGIPVITSVNSGIKKLPAQLIPIWESDVQATNIYNLIVKNKFNTILPDDYRMQPVINS